MEPSRGFKIAALVVALSVLATIAVAFGGAPSIVALAVPLFGPWAGMLYGHWDCTMAHQLPGWTLALCLALIAWVAALVRVRNRAGRIAAGSAAVLWVIAWELLALISVVNANS